MRRASPSQATSREPRPCPMPTAACSSVKTCDSSSGPSSEQVPIPMWRAVVRHRDRARMDQRRGGRHRGNGETRLRLLHRTQRGHRDHRRRQSAGQGNLCTGASELGREEVDLSEIWVSVKCGESDTTSGIASNPTVGNAIEKLVCGGLTCSFGETSEITGAELICKGRAATSEVGNKFYTVWNEYNDFITGPQDGRSFGIAAHPWEHPRRVDHDRGKSLRQPPEDREKGGLHRCTGTRGTTQRPRSVVHEHLLRRCGSGNPSGPPRVSSSISFPPGRAT